MISRSDFRFGFPVRISGSDFQDGFPVRFRTSIRVDFSVMLSPISFFENQVKSNRKIDPLGDPDRVDFSVRFDLTFEENDGG